MNQDSNREDGPPNGYRYGFKSLAYSKKTMFIHAIFIGGKTKIFLFEKIIDATHMQGAEGMITKCLIILREKKNVMTLPPNDVLPRYMNRSKNRSPCGEVHYEVGKF